MSTMQMLSSSARSLEQQKIIGTRSFKLKGRTYHEPKLVFYTGRTQTGCGVGQHRLVPSTVQPTKRFYLDMSFYKELTTKYKASGDFDMAYVIAHEVGHHVQNELGILGKYHRMQQGLSEKERKCYQCPHRATSRLPSRCLGPLHSRPKSSRYRRYRRSHECSPCSRGRHSPRASLRLLGTR